MTDYLLENHHIKMLVIACNTTAIALEDIQRKTDIPVVGVIQPGARTAIKVTKTSISASSARSIPLKAERMSRRCSG